VKSVAKQIEDENEYDDEDDDIPERCVSPAQYLQFIATCCQ
jgi:hypothetical protein